MWRSNGGSVLPDDETRDVLQLCEEALHVLEVAIAPKAQAILQRRAGKVEPMGAMT